MARIDLKQRQLEIKLVYYGPAVGGKTTNLQSLHRLLDPEGRARLMSLDTRGDRTLFFDLLPVELRLGRQLSLKLRLFTVPGQVHYNATRRLVLQQADGVVFVADSSPGRLRAGRDSLLSLDGNLVANGLAPGDVPIVLQANKRDLPDAAPLDELLAALAPEELPHHAASVQAGLHEACAPTGEGVLETFEALLRSTLASVHRRNRLQAAGLGRRELAAALDEVLAPLRARPSRGPKPTPEVGAAGDAAASPARDAGSAKRDAAASGDPRGGPAAEASGAWSLDRSAGAADPEDVLATPELLEESVRQSMDLAETLGDQHALGRRLEERVGELECLQRLSLDLAGARSVDEVARASCEAAATALPGSAASFLRARPDGGFEVLALSGRDEDPLAAREGLLARPVFEAGSSVHFADTDTELVYGDRALNDQLAPACTLAACRVGFPAGEPGLLVAYGSDPERPAGEDTTRFLSAIAGMTRLSLEVVARQAEIASHRDRLQEEVAERTAELRLAHGQLVAASRLRDRVMSCVNHELRTPVTRLFSAAQALDRARPGTQPPKALLDTLLSSARSLRVLLDQVLNAHALLRGPAGEQEPEESSCDLRETLRAVVFTCREKASEREIRVQVRLPEEPLEIAGDAGSVTVLLAQLLDNALKFAPAGSSVRLSAAQSAGGQAEIAVSDEGPGVPAADAERIFDEFDQGRADLLVAKPDGLGLGLPIARRLARRLGGDVVLATDGSGGGARFLVRLPARCPVGA